MTAAQRVIVCEGYHDRAFWKGWLKRNGCRPWDLDPWGQRVKGGQHGWLSPSGAFVRVIPARGDLRQVLRLVQIYLRNAATEPVPVIVVSTDADGRPIADRRADVIANLKALIEATDLGVPAATADDLRLGPTVVRPLIWPCHPVAIRPGVPAGGTLETLVCGVLAHQETARGDTVHGFLQTAGDGDGWRRPADIGKSHAWAWMAHRQPVDECERFFEVPWEDEAFAAELEAAMGERAGEIMRDLLA